jgi:hypothetical protein
VTSTNGFLNIRSISIVNQTLQALEGDFRVNLEMDGAKAGAADGTISYSSK